MTEVIYIIVGGFIKLLPRTPCVLIIGRYTTIIK